MSRDKKSQKKKVKVKTQNKKIIVKNVDIWC